MARRPSFGDINRKNRQNGLDAVFDAFKVHGRERAPRANLGVLFL